MDFYLSPPPSLQTLPDTNTSFKCTLVDIDLRTARFKQTFWAVLTNSPLLFQRQVAPLSLKVTFVLLDLTVLQYLPKRIQSWIQMQFLQWKILVKFTFNLMFTRENWNLTSKNSILASYAIFVKENLCKIFKTETIETLSHS